MTDLYDLDPKEVEKFQKLNKPINDGLFCPRRNRELTGTCKVCERVNVLFRSGKEDDKKIALDKMAKTSYLAIGVFPHKRDEWVIMELIKSLGDSIEDGVKNKGWTSIVNPKAGKGRCLVFMKRKGNLGFSTYSVDPKLEYADWDVSQEMLDSIPNIVDYPIQSLDENKEKIFKISSLKEGESLEVRLLPWAKEASIRNPLGVVFRHWGVTQDEIDGVVEMDLTTTEQKREQAEKESMDSPINEPKKSSEQNKAEAKADKPKEIKSSLPCFGNPTLFNAEDEECRDKCKFFKACAKKVLENSAPDDDIPF